MRWIGAAYPLSLLRVQILHLDFMFEVQIMNEKRYKKKLEFQEKIILRQSGQIEDLKFQIEKLKLEIKEKNELLESVDYMRKELLDNINEIKQKKNEYKKLIEELKTMKNIINENVYKNKWRLVKFLLK